MLSRLMTQREQWVLGGLAFALILGAASLYWHDQRTPLPETAPAGPGTTVPTPPAPTTATPGPALPAVPALPPAVTPAEALPPAPPMPVVIGVAVMGAVSRPGLYSLEAGARVQDLLEMAGGASGDADLSDVNRLATLIDGTTLTVPRLPEREHSDHHLALRATDGDRHLNPSAYLYSGMGVDAWTAAGPAPAQDPIAPETSATSSTAGGLINLNSASAEELATLPGIGPALAGRIIAYREQHPFETVEALKDVSGIGEKRFEAIQALVAAP